MLKHYEAIRERHITFMQPLLLRWKKYNLASSNAFRTLAPMPPTWFVDQTVSQNGLFGGKISINWAEPGSHGGSPILYYRVKYYKLRSGVTVCDSAAVDQSFSDTVIY